MIFIPYYLFKHQTYFNKKIRKKTNYTRKRVRISLFFPILSIHLIILSKTLLFFGCFCRNKKYRQADKSCYNLYYMSN